MSRRSKLVIGFASLVIFAMAAVVEIRRGLEERDEQIRSATAWIKSETIRAEELRLLGANSFTPESHVTYGEARVRELRESDRPIIGGLLRAAFDLCLLLPLAIGATYLVAVAARHPSRRHVGAVAVRLGLPLLCVGVALFVLWVIVVGLTLGPLAVPAG